LRVSQHPILETKKGKPITIVWDGREIPALEGEPVAAALMAAGVLALRKTAILGEPRGVFCAIGRCTDCVMIVDGVPNVRTCVTPARDGMDVRTQVGLEKCGEEHA